jgi:peptide/nickel transport system substrate-binding protein
MRVQRWLAIAALFMLSLPAVAAEEPKRGGTLTYLIPADAPPSFDGHRETTYATVHSVSPFYSVLIRINPENPSSTTDFLCDLCTEIPQPTEGGKTYTFKIRTDAKFTDGSPLSAADVAASWRMIVNPPDGVTSGRQAFYTMVEKVAAPDPTTVVFNLKFATTAFLPALADPFAYIYKKEILDKDPHWYEKNILGSGPFKFTSYDAGQSIRGERNPDYYHKGLPYLDGFVAIYAPKLATRVDAIRGDRAALEFRSQPPSARDQLVKELGDQITVQESDWNCGNLLTYNHKRKPFDDVRVRRALSLAIDQWKGAPGLSKIAIVRTVAGIVFPGSPLAATKEELQQLAGFWPDIEKSRRSQASPEGSGRRKSQLRDAEPRCRSALQIRRHLCHRRVEQDRSQGHAKGGPDRPLVRRHAERQFRRDDGGELPKRRQPGARCQQVPAIYRVHRELRRLRGPGGDRSL